MSRPPRTTTKLAPLALVLSLAGLGVVAPVASAHASLTGAVAQDAMEAKFDDKAIEVLERAAEAQFGEHAKKRSVKGIRMKGNLSMPAQGLSADIEIIQSKGDMLTVVNIPGFGKMTEGFTDGQGWSFSELQGPAIKTDAENAQAAQQSDIYAALDFKNYFASAEYVGTETIKDYEGNEREAHKLVLVNKETDVTSTTYFDVETGHQIRSDSEMLMQGAKMPTTMFMGDYRDVEGMTLPHMLKSTFGPMEQTVTISEVELNPSVDEEAFKTPAEVTALIEKKKQNDS